ncbi:hypothetical protein M413DRAFT_80038 [Hebeloma cylindrosporum]|uniref:Uncharacterized protein n=1 Tax=Hebeloma cylindrosporum TaxID=76867 RepID=A0A0C2X9T7_HEBCY|nr:hypothetical protein M413DRAFT_80049 [Hebeloma cylindrosporum h7]KIM34793.1 hypothetical protein M413DRAFT_80038 [Hebeloma cylindrosporum h7]
MIDQYSALGNKICRSAFAPAFAKHERNALDIVSIHDKKKLYNGIKQALVCGFFMEVAHNEGAKGSYYPTASRTTWYIRRIMRSMRSKLLLIY